MDTYMDTKTVYRSEGASLNPRSAPLADEGLGPVRARKGVREQPKAAGRNAGCRNIALGFQ